MDPILQTLLSWQFIIFGMAVAAIVFVIRKVVEYFLPSKDTKLWNDLLLPIIPVFLGVVLGWVFKTFPYPDGLTTTGDRIVFGLVAGLLSTLMYRVMRSLLIQKIQAVDPQTATTVQQVLPATVESNLPPRGTL